jgi:hypothetical protein
MKTGDQSTEESFSWTQPLPHQGSCLLPLFLFLGLCGVPGFALIFLGFPDGTLALIVWVVSGALLSNLLVAAGIAWSNRSTNRLLRALQEREALVRWRYRHGEVDPVLTAEYRGHLSILWGAPLAGLALGLLLAAVSAPDERPGSSTLEKMPRAARLFLGLGVGLGIGGLGYLLLERQRRWRLRAPRVACIGREAAYCCGKFWNWGTAWNRLEGVDWVAGRTVLLRFRLRVGSPGVSDVDQSFDVPVPAGHEAEARELYRKLTGKDVTEA